MAARAFFRARRLGPGAPGTITGPQRVHLRRLMAQAFVLRVPTVWDIHHLDTLSMVEASQAIQSVGAAIRAARGQA